MHRAIRFLFGNGRVIFGDFSTLLIYSFHLPLAYESLRAQFSRIRARFLFLFLAFSPSLSSFWWEWHNTSRHALSVFIFRILPRQENEDGKDEERWSLRGREILLLTLVSQLNPLASAINILVMMSDEPPRGGRSGSEENEILSDDVKGGKRKGANEKKRQRWIDGQTDR